MSTPSSGRSLPAQQASPLVRIRQNGREYDVRCVPDQTLLTAALSQGAALTYKCLQGECGKCSVQLLAGSSALRSPGAKEREKLGDKLALGYRLACQSSFSSLKQR
ncbi:2Fe-2S iron-sulfur cluster binding domain-containing protein [Brevibacillus sp. GCM10020057]|uniref:2Fe-2S iron-sulfur cluster binding domain-containing protein n=1 Tax=Brevibacillus sp. GCM10020057 TaxID=3317327 RepID=UPI00362AD19A